ncbi:MAG: hypothetical protein RJA22_1173 [Verrucomicrobiota bacterium]
MNSSSSADPVTGGGVVGCRGRNISWAAARRWLGWWRPVLGSWGVVGLAGGLAAGCASWRVEPRPAPDLAEVIRRAESLPDPRQRNALLVGALHERVQEFQCLVARNLELRERILGEANRLEARFRERRALEAEDLKLVSDGAARYLALRGELLALVDRYQCLLGYSEQDFVDKGVDPRVRVVAVMVSIGAALTLYDNYLTTVVRFERSPSLRRYVNDGDPRGGVDRGKLEEIGHSARSIVNRGQVRAALLRHEEWQRKWPAWRDRFHDPAQGPDVLGEDFEYLEALIHTSVSYAFIRDVRLGLVGSMKLNALSHSAMDFWRLGSDAALQSLSRVFVEAVAVVDLRGGLLVETPERQATNLARLRTILRPGDILVEKSPFRLNDRLVPGYWGHAALWLGAEEELTALGVWETAGYRRAGGALGEDPRGRVRAGAGLIESARGGVRLNTLEKFMNVDGLAVLRPRLAEDAARRAELGEVLGTALGQLGKRYDFGFDVHTPGRIVCSELIFHSYDQPEFAWPRSSVLGRYTVSPDQVAWRALRGAGGQPPLRLVALFRDGLEVEGGEEVRRMVLEELMPSARAAGVP